MSELLPMMFGTSVIILIIMILGIGIAFLLRREKKKEIKDEAMTNLSQQTTLSVRCRCSKILQFVGWEKTNDGYAFVMKCDCCDDTVVISSRRIVLPAGKLDVNAYSKLKGV